MRVYHFTTWPVRSILSEGWKLTKSNSLGEHRLSWVGLILKYDQVH